MVSYVDAEPGKEKVKKTCEARTTTKISQGLSLAYSPAIILADTYFLTPTTRFEPFARSTFSEKRDRHKDEEQSELDEMSLINTVRLQVCITNMQAE